MYPNKIAQLSSIFCFISLFLIFTGCSNGEVVPSTIPLPSDTAQVDDTTTPNPTLTITPTPPEEINTQVPFAALVNEEVISLEELQAEFARYQMIPGTGLATYSEAKILDDLIDQLLLAQTANDLGFVVDEVLLDTRIKDLGLSEHELNEWMQNYGYSEEDFRQTMRRAIASAWMRDQIIAEVPEVAEQVHARQILLYNSNLAETVYNQLETGTEFGTLAAQYDPVTSGDLGWFPRGYLNVNELDDVLFSLEPGNYSNIIKTALGFLIVQVIERDLTHPLTVDARRVLQVQVLVEWLENQRNQSEIVIQWP